MERLIIISKWSEFDLGKVTKMRIKMESDRGVMSRNSRRIKYFFFCNNV